MTNSRLVYSTGGDSNCSRCGKPLRKCQCGQLQKESRSDDGVIRIRRESKGRGGKDVTVITGLGLDEAGLKQWAKKLKAACGSGGTAKHGVVEIQGDKRSQVQQLLEQEGFKVKQAGG